MLAVFNGLPAFITGVDICDLFDEPDCKMDEDISIPEVGSVKAGFGGVDVIPLIFEIGEIFEFVNKVNVAFAVVEGVLTIVTAAGEVVLLTVVPFNGGVEERGGIVVVDVTLLKGFVTEGTEGTDMFLLESVFCVEDGCCTTVLALVLEREDEGLRLFLFGKLDIEEVDVVNVATDEGAVVTVVF
jgi:hypothetical protein